MKLPPGLLRDFLRRDGAPFAELSLEHADADPVAWEGALAEILARRSRGLPVPRSLADFACDVATGRMSKPRTKHRDGNALRNWRVQTAVKILIGSLSERAARRYVADELGLSYEAVRDICEK